jgi:hypothetical protein
MQSEMLQGKDNALGQSPSEGRGLAKWNAARLEHFPASAGSAQAFRPAFARRGGPHGDQIHPCYREALQSPCGLFQPLSFGCAILLLISQEFLMTITELEQAVTQLTEQELARFREWFDEYYTQLWDKQIEEDAKSGRLDRLLAEVEEEINDLSIRHNLRSLHLSNF